METRGSVIYNGGKPEKPREKSHKTGKSLSKISGKLEKAKQAAEMGKKSCRKLEKATKSCGKPEKDLL